MLQCLWSARDVGGSLLSSMIGLLNSVSFDVCSSISFELLNSVSFGPLNGFGLPSIDLIDLISST